MLAKKFALGFGIAIILPAMVHYGVMTFSPLPQYSDYRIENYSQRYSGATPEEKERLREESRALAEKRKTQQERFQRHLFYVSVPIGIAAIIIGAFLNAQAIGSGLMFGGIFTVMDGYLWYWSRLHPSMKFGSLLIVFILLIFIGCKKIVMPQPDRQK